MLDAPLNRGLGARISESKPWADKYPLRLGETADAVERTLGFAQAWREYYYQNGTNGCVGYSTSEAATYLNRRRFDPEWLWNEAKKIDYWPETNPGDNEGTSVAAAMDVLRTQGHVYVKRGVAQAPSKQWGIDENRWATSVGDIRTSIAKGVPVVMGTWWFGDFDSPQQKENGEWFCGQENWERSERRGGHAYMFNAASDRRQAFRTPNTWGVDWPQVWFPYSVVERLLDMDGEATLITDHIGL